MVRIDALQKALARHEPRLLPPPERLADHASVAMILAGADADLRLCFIRRAHRPDDRWSGQMAFPGGRGSPEDASTRHVAIRETLEEVGVVLADGHGIGRLSDLEIRRRGLDVDGIISPFLWYIGETAPPLRPNHEVADAHWIPLSHLWDPRNFGTIDIPIRGVPEEKPGIRFLDQIIWGLTYRILTTFAEVLGTPLPSGPAA